MQQYDLPFPSRRGELSDDLLVALGKESWNVKLCDKSTRKICIRCGASIEVAESTILCPLCPIGIKGRMIPKNELPKNNHRKLNFGGNANVQLELFKRGENFGTQNKRSTF
jgi:hypothetical protein